MQLRELKGDLLCLAVHFGHACCAVPTRAGAVRMLAVPGRDPARPKHYAFRFNGDGFLRHMVRNLAGTLIWAGAGKIGREQFAAVLAGKDRRLAGPTAPACGLFLEKVEY